MRTANIYINQSALSHNLEQVKQHLLHHGSSSNILAMVKANAYGHDVSLCLPALSQADGVGVATFEEALQVRQLGWQKILVMIEGVFSLEEWLQAIKQEICCIIHHQQQLNWALEHPPKDGNAAKTVWLKYNTGMNRLGFKDEELIHASQLLTQAGYQLVLTSHFANADEPSHPMNAEQGHRFQQMLETLKQTVNKNIKASLCNSAGLIHFPNWHYDWVRPGIMLYGSSPTNQKTADQLHLQPVMSFTANIIALQQVKQGDKVGYGGLWQAPKDSLLALISIGYGDGYPRVIDNQCTVSITVNGQYHLCPIRGRVAMDMMVIDISELPKSAQIGIDSPVTLWGQSPHIDEVAKHANTISYELLCRLTNRPRRMV